MGLPFDFLLAGVGGQGTILAGDILAEAGVSAGFEVKKSEVHGMAQRGGGVESHVRWGTRVYSPLVERGRANFLVAFEMLEGARWAGYLAPGALAIVNCYRQPPLSVNLGQQRYPGVAEVEGLFSGRRLWWVDATGVARRLGNPAVAGVVLLGALSTCLPVEPACWVEAIERLVPPRHVAINRQAFEAGRALPAEARPS